MQTLTKSLVALAVTALLGSCSRPVATFQPSKAERFYTAQTPAPAVAEETTVAQPVAAPAAEVVAVAPAELPKAQIEQALTKAEVYASTNARPAAWRKLSRRITKIREVLTAQPQAVPATNAAKKPSLVQRVMLKSMDKKIQKHLAPEQPKAVGTLTAGLIIGLIGLLLLLL